jgi:hypothetical protein
MFNLKLPLNEMSRLQTFVLSLRSTGTDIDTPLFDLACEIVYGETDGTN